MWQYLPPALGSDIVRQGYIASYLGITIETQPSIPYGRVVYCGDPADRGRYANTLTPLRHLMDTNIRNRTVYHAWDIMYEYIIGNAADVWVMTIS